MTMTTDWKMAWRRAALAGAAGLGVLSVALACMMTVNYAQLRRVDPVNLPELARLRMEYAGQQGNEALKQQIRALDLMARKALFTTRRQLAVGSFVLVGCVAGGVLLWLVAGMMAEIGPDVRRLPKAGGGWVRRREIRSGLLIGGGLLMGVAVMSWIGSPPLMELTGDDRGQGGKGQRGKGEERPWGHGLLQGREERLANWPGFRGPHGNGVAEVKAAPVKWDVPRGDGVKWKVALLLPGFSSPIVWGKRVFLTAGDQEKRVIYGVDLDSGAMVWTAEVGVIPGAGKVPDVTEDTGYAASTPVTDGRRVYAIFATGELLCVDMEGREVWKRFLGTPENHYGHSSSLVVDGRLLYVQMDDAAKPRLMALDVATGATVWEKARRAISWSSPVLVEEGGRRELVLCDSEGVESYNPGTGGSLWRVDCLGGEQAPSAGYGNGMLVVAGDGAKASGLKLGAGQPEVVWEWTDGLPDAASPLVFGNRVMLATSGSTLILLALDTGKAVWTKELTKPCYASPVLAAGRVYLQDLDGVMHVMEAGDVYKEVATCPLGEMAGATPAFVEGRILIRGARSLVCVEGVGGGEGRGGGDLRP